jgi:2'-5' RNA ligase
MRRTERQEAEVQGVFDFYRDEPERPKLPDRLFYAVFPDAETAAQIAWRGAHFLREHHLEWTLFSAPRFHLSLHHAGDYKRLRGSRLYPAQLAGAAVSAPGFEVRLYAIGSLDNLARAEGGPYPLVLLAEGDGLSALYRRLGAAMNRVGLKASEDLGHSKPHVTLCYGPRPLPLQAIEPIRFAVRELVLVHSKLGVTQYEMLERWPLVG